MRTSTDPIQIRFMEEREVHQENVARMTKKYEVVYNADPAKAREELLHRLQRTASEYEEADVIAVKCRTGRVWIYVTSSHVLQYGPLPKYQRMVRVEDLGEGWHYYELEEPLDLGS